MDRIRVLIADDHFIVRFGLRALLGMEPAIEVVGEAGTGEEVIECATLLQPQVILMDLKMPGINGIEATKRIRETHPQIHILVLTVSDDDDSVFAAMGAGARGYVLKGSSGEETMRAIISVSNGEGFWSPEIAQRLPQFLSRSSPVRPSTLPASPTPSARYPDITPREQEILCLMVQGYTNAAIVEKLVLSSHTVRHHITNIFRKLQVGGVGGRAEAIQRMRDFCVGKEER